MLRSQLFQGDKRLNKCAVDPSSHVKLHDKGDFVSKIQEALVILDNALLIGNDVSTQTYGDSTESAVFDYKSNRKIINHSYQNAPDKIVGVMTITRMDKDMFELEQKMPDIIQRARQLGFQRTFAAFLQVSTFGPSSPPQGRPDVNQANRQRGRDLAVAI